MIKLTDMTTEQALAYYQGQLDLLLTLATRVNQITKPFSSLEEMQQQFIEYLLYHKLCKRNITLNMKELQEND